MPPQPYLWVIPALVVPDVELTASWLRDALGFRICSLSGSPAEFGIVDLAPGRALHLKRGAARTNREADIWDVYIEVEDLAGVADDLQARGAPMIRGPESRPYGMLELEIETLDGHRICYAQRA